MYQLTKEFNFAISHRLEGHKGLCNNVHGHNYKLFVTVKRIDNKLIKNNKSSEGMITDFKDLKKFVNSIIVDEFDHAFVYNSNDKDSVKIALFLQKLINQKILGLEIKTTAEAMSQWMLEELNEFFKTQTDDKLECIEIKLYETDTSYAVYGK